MSYKGLASDYKEKDGYQDYPPGYLASTEEETPEEGEGVEHLAVIGGVTEVDLLQGGRVE